MKGDPDGDPGGHKMKQFEYCASDLRRMSRLRECQSASMIWRRHFWGRRGGVILGRDGAKIWEDM